MGEWGARKVHKDTWLKESGTWLPLVTGAEFLPPGPIIAKLTAGSSQSPLPGWQELHSL